MLYSKEIYKDGTTVGIWKMEEDVESLLSLFAGKQPEYRTDIARFSSIKRKLEYLSVRCLLKELTGVENTVSYNQKKYPSLVDNALKISISHTERYVSVITHPERVVGVDIEQKRDKILRLKHKFLSGNELRNITAEKELEHLLLHWSAKETMFKMMGETDVDFVSHLHILPFLPSASGTLECYETKTNQRQKFCLNYKDHDEYVLVWGCTQNKIT